VAVFTYAAFAACFLVAAAARFAAYRFLSAATIAARPAGDSLRFGFLALSGEAPVSAFCSAHRRRCAAAIARLAAALIRCVRLTGSAVVELPFLPLPSIRRRQLGAEQSGSSGFKRQATHGCQLQVDRRRSKTACLRVQAIAKTTVLLRPVAAQNERNRHLQTRVRKQVEERTPLRLYLATQAVA
jgi:hypothetical protein